jgi:hypothetical protein
MKIIMCIERATMLTGSNLERIPIFELLTLVCLALALMYSSLLEVTETFTDMEPSSNFKIVRQSEGPYTCRK